MGIQRLKYLKAKAKALLDTADGEEFLELLSHMVGFEKRSLTFDGSTLNKDRLLIDSAQRDLYLNIKNLKTYNPKGDKDE